MKKIILLFIAIFTINMLSAQEVDKNSFLFDGFKDAVVIYKDGRQFSVPLNYNLKEERFIFIDKSDNLQKKFANPELIGLVRVGHRCFVIDNNDLAKEVIQTAPLFYVMYVGNKKPAPKSTGFGGISEIASVDSYSSLPGNSISSGIKNIDIVVDGITKKYEADFNGKLRKFDDKNSFIKLMPKNKRMEIEKYINNNNINFENINQVLVVYNKFIQNNNKTNNSL